jgi:pimeloyl-ACP methyl ester carboxylesterase
VSEARKVCAVAVSAMVLIGYVAVATNTATASSVERCGQVVDDRPVVLAVHGFTGNPGQWEEDGPSGSMSDALSRIEEVNVVDPFSYEDNNDKWVTNENIGPALAAQINCLSDASVEAGGDGKLIILSHSMGFLALRQSMNPMVEGHVKPEKVGAAFAIGAPNEGAAIAKTPLGHYYTKCGIDNWRPRCVENEAVRAMRPGSKELRTLPALPKSVTVRAITTDIVSRVTVLGRHYDRHFGDGVVTVESAMSARTEGREFDGGYVVKCIFPQTSQCLHGDQLKNAKVQRLVVEGLELYVAARPSPTCTPTANPTPTLSGGEIGGAGESGGAIEGMGGEPSVTPAEPSPTVVPSQPSCV